MNNIYELSETVKVIFILDEWDFIFHQDLITEELFSEAFGFTESEVDKLYSRYLEWQPRPGVSREDLRLWYGGYHTHSGERVYNPRSVVASLTNNNLGNYWIWP